MPSATGSQLSTSTKAAANRIAVSAITFRGGKEPRLRFDRTAIGLVRRLQATLAESVPDGKSVVVTITAPIRQDSRTGLALQARIRALLASRRAQFKATINGNRVQVRVLNGGGSRTAKLIGFVHNPERPPALLFDVTRRVLACMGSSRRSHRGTRWLVIGNRNGLAPVETIRQVCLALRARTVFKRILLAGDDGVRLL